MKQVVLGVVAVAACPCTYPLYFALLGGTALGGALAAYHGWLITGLAVIFVGAVAALMVRLIRSTSPACAVRPPVEHLDTNREPWSEGQSDVGTAHAPR